MRQNMDKAIDKDNKLSDLDNRAGKFYLVKFVIFTLMLQDPEDNSMLDMLIGYSCIQIRILLLLLSYVTLGSNLWRLI